MKKLLIVILSLLMIQSMYAQDAPKETSAIYKKGRLMLGLSRLNVSHSQTIRDGSGNPISGFLGLGANLRTGLFVKDRWMLGIDLGYTFNSYKSRDVNFNALSVSAFSRHYVPISKKLSFFTEVSVGYSRTFYSNQSDTWAQESSFSLGADAGLAYQLGKRISVEASMGYRLNFHSNSVNLHNTGPKLGFNFHF